MSDPNTYTFSKPIMVIDKLVESVTLREPTGEDLEKAGDATNQAAYTRRLAEILANLPSGTLKTAPGKDVVKIGRMVADFLKDDPSEA